MRPDRADQLFFQFKESVPSDRTAMLADMLHRADDRCYGELCATSMHNPLIIVLISVFLGGLGVDRFMLGDIGMGVAKLLLGWLTLGIWPLIDIYFCYKRALDLNMQKISDAIARYGYNSGPAKGGDAYSAPYGAPYGAPGQGGYPGGAPYQGAPYQGTPYQGNPGQGAPSQGDRGDTTGNGDNGKTV